MTARPQVSGAIRWLAELDAIGPCDDEERSALDIARVESIQIFGDPKRVTARDSHTAAWSGGEMIVWGGRNNTNQILNTGAKYNPIIDGWTVTSTINVPEQRLGHTAVWTGNEMFVGEEALLAPSFI